MKESLLLTVLTLCHCLGIAQLNFQKSYGGAGNERAHTVVATQDKGYAIVGVTNSFGAGRDDIFIVKVDSNGTIQWQKTYGGALDEFGYSINMIEAPDGGLLVTGLTGSNIVQVSELYFFKTDANGNLLWDFAYDSGDKSFTSADHGRSILYTEEGNIYVFGTDDGDSFGSNDGLIIKTDSNGNLIYKKVYGDHSNEHVNDAIELPGGNLLACGSAGSFGPGEVAGYLLKVDPNGNLFWANTYGGSDFDAFNACDKTHDFGIVAAGVTTSFGNGPSDALLCKIDSSGNLLWSKTFGGSNDERFASVKTLPDGSGYLMTGYTTSYGNGSSEILVVRTNSSGDLIWARTFGTQGFERVDTWAKGTMDLTEDGGFVIAGWSDSISIAGEDIVVIKNDMDGSSLCDEVDIELSSPLLATLSTETNVASPGTYTAISSTVSNAFMIAQEFCYCIDECHKCEETVVHYDLNACYSILGDVSEMDYSEFIPAYPSTLSYAAISASIVHRSNAGMNKHSCTPGVEDSPAMCVSSFNSCFYDPGNVQSVVFELTIAPDPDSSVRVTSLSFYEKAPTMFSWINGASGLNNYPTLYAIRVLKNDTEIFLQDGIATTIDVWSQEMFDFSLDDAFVAEDSTTFRFELLAYCLVGNLATVTAWDLDEISIAVSCDPVTGGSNNISGVIRNPENDPLSNMDLLLSHDPVFQTYIANSTTDQNGQFTFKRIPSGNHLYLRGYYNTDFLNGVSTLDLIHVQKHLLGLQPFTSPYQMIAADANRSNTVSVLDMIDLRKLILGRITELPNNTSWRFAIADQELTLVNPWNYAEIFSVPDVGLDIGNAHFVGIKTGDVTFDAETNLHNAPVTLRSGNTIHLRVKDQYLKTDEASIIEITGRDLIEMSGFQFALQCRDFEILSIHSNEISINDEHMHFTENGILFVSWNDVKSLARNTTDVSLQLLVLPKRNGLLSGLMEINRTVLDPQVYLGEDLNVSSLDLQFFAPEVTNIAPQQSILWNEPNPFKTGTTLHFKIDNASDINLRFYDVSGKLLHNYKKHFSTGEHELRFTQREFGILEGTVFCHFIAGEKTAVCKMILAE